MRYTNPRLLYFIAYKEFKDGLFISETKQQVTTAP